MWNLSCETSHVPLTPTPTQSRASAGCRFAGATAPGHVSVWRRILSWFHKYWGRLGGPPQLRSPISRRKFGRSFLSLSHSKNVYDAIFLQLLHHGVSKYGGVLLISRFYASNSSIVLKIYWRFFFFFFRRKDFSPKFEALWLFKGSYIQLHQFNFILTCNKIFGSFRFFRDFRDWLHFYDPVIRWTFFCC